VVLEKEIRRNPQIINDASRIAKEIETLRITSEKHRVALIRQGRFQTTTPPVMAPTTATVLAHAYGQGGSPKRGRRRQRHPPSKKGIDKASDFLVRRSRSMPSRSPNSNAIAQVAPKTPPATTKSRPG